MAFAIIVFIVALTALLTGGKIENLKNIDFRHSWLVILAVAGKIITNSSLRNVFHISDKMAPFLYVISLLLIIIFILLNTKQYGLPILGLGLFCNLLVIVSNRGYMPVKLDYYKTIATADELEKLNQGLPFFNHIATSSHTKLYYLADIFLMPSWIFITRVFSIGDVLITIGASIFIWKSLRSFNNTYYY
jgi:hypothetical protein